MCSVLLTFLVLLLCFVNLKRKYDIARTPNPYLLANVALYLHPIDPWSHSYVLTASSLVKAPVHTTLTYALPEPTAVNIVFPEPWI